MAKSDTGPFCVMPEWLVLAVDSAPALRVFALLASRWADREDDQAFPSRATIASALAISLDSVDRAIKILVGARAIEVRPRFSDDGDRTSNEYRLLFSDPSRRNAGGGRADAATPSRADAALTRTNVIQSSSASSARAREGADERTRRAMIAYENCCGSLTKAIGEAIGEWLDRVEAADRWIEAACEEAAKSNARSWRFIEAVLRRYEREGFGPRADRKPKPRQEANNGRAPSSTAARRWRR